MPIQVDPGNRSTFGGTHQDVVLDTSGPFLRLSDARVTFWDSEVGGTRYTDLLDAEGLPTAAIDSKAGQLPLFYGPDGVVAMWADDGDNERHLMLATDTQTIAAAKDTAVQAKNDAEAAAGSVAREEPGGVAGLDSAGLLFPSRVPDLPYVGKGEQVIDAADYGFSTSATATENVTALTDAVAATNDKGANAELFIRPGTYQINGTVQISCHLRAEQATLQYSGSGTALIIGVNTSGTVTARKRFSLPRVVKATQEWDGTSVGVRLVNLNTCDVYVPFVQNFERGLVVYGFDQGTAYCTIVLGALWQNHKNLIIDADSTGWSNQNTYLGGRLQQTVTGGAVDDDTSANQILIGETDGVSPNQNTFVGTSIEGDNPAYYRLDCNGRYNHFVNCRWEALGGQSRVRWGADASGNVIDHGYDAHLLVETVVSGAYANEIRDRDGAYVSASNTSGFSVPNNAYTVVTGWTNDSRRAPYTSDTSSWVPRQGRWRITAQVSFSAAAGGIRRIGLYVDGTQVAVNGTPNPGSESIQVEVSVSRRFNGAEALTVRAFQDSGAAVPLTTTAHTNRLHAEYVGP